MNGIAASLLLLYKIYTLMKKITTMGLLSLLFFICISAKPVKQTYRAHHFKNATATCSFGFFRAHHQGKNITASWGLTSDAGVAGFSVQRTNEDPNDPYSAWYGVASIPCNSSRSYKWIDENVLPGYISYCIVAVMNDGTTVPSEIITVRIVSH